MKNLIKKLIESTGYSLVNTRALDAPQKQKQITRDDFFNLYFSKVDPVNFFFVQIGAHDGVHGDPIHKYISDYNLRGVVVEPQADVFQKLLETYKNTRVLCVNAAIGEGGGIFYTVKNEFKDLDNFNKMTRIASFKKDVVKKSLVTKIPHGADPEDYIQETPIKMLSFYDLNLEEIDMLQIDAEGYDYEILKMLDFRQFSPGLINLESQHFSEQTRKECESFLVDRGYKLFRYGGDTCAYKA